MYTYVQRLKNSNFHNTHIAEPSHSNYFTSKYRWYQQRKVFAYVWLSVKSLPKNLKYIYIHYDTEHIYDCSLVSQSIFEFPMDLLKENTREIKLPQSFSWNWIVSFSVARLLCKCVPFHWCGFIYSFGMWKKVRSSIISLKSVCVCVCDHQFFHSFWFEMNQEGEKATTTTATLTITLQRQQQQRQRQRWQQ